LKLKSTVIILLLSFFFFVTKEVRAQLDSVNNAYYFDDDEGYLKNILKLNLTGPLVGDISVHFERKITDFFTVEIGTGLVIPNGALLRNYKPFEKEVENGYSLSLATRFYLRNDAPEGLFYGLMAIERNYTSQEMDIKWSQFEFIVGGQFEIRNRLILDCFFGMGAEFAQATGTDISDDLDTEASNPVLRFAVNLGYIL